MRGWDSAWSACANESASATESGAIPFCWNAAVKWLIDRDLARHAQPYQLNNGTIITEIDTEYFLVFGDDRHQFVGVNYCPFCGRILSRELWNLEKKK